mmetsp:Transcript_31936/g.55549  ORF Transcript_31936/g.55549 Transcript_31936/m.55549 type:complete len:257 (+) Transcript_31936:37-807(+)
MFIMAKSNLLLAVLLLAISVSNAFVGHHIRVPAVRITKAPQQVPVNNIKTTQWDSLCAVKAPLRALLPGAFDQMNASRLAYNKFYLTIAFSASMLCRFRNSPSYLAEHPEVREGYIAEAEVIAKANLDKLQSYPRPAQYIGYCINDVISFMMARFASSPADLMRACIKGGMSQTDPQFRWMIVLNDPFVTILMIISLYTIFPSLCQTRKEMAGAYISWLDRVVYQRIVEARLSLIHLWDAIAARSSLVLHRDKSMQ